MEIDRDKAPFTDREIVAALRECASNCGADWKAVLDRAADRLEILSEETGR